MQSVQIIEELTVKPTEKHQGRRYEDSRCSASWLWHSLLEGQFFPLSLVGTVNKQIRNVKVVSAPINVDLVLIDGGCVAPP